MHAAKSNNKKMATSAVTKIKRNKLQFERQIGEGSFSSVFQMAWLSPSLGPVKVAAKRLNKRDVRELDIMSGLDHPNIVKLIGVVDEEIDFMLILELCERGSLSSFLKERQGKRVSEKQFYDWAEQAARPLGYLRKQHIVHKDVKSPNYMITADNNLKLGDFGIAKNIAQTIDNATETASYPWMAPELLTEGILSPKYDIFAYGVVVWEMRTGKIPFDGLEPRVIAWRVCHENQRLPIPEECPQPITDLMMQCWETDWKKRPDIDEVIAMIVQTATANQETTQEHDQRPEQQGNEASSNMSECDAAKNLLPVIPEEDVCLSSQNATAEQILTGRWKLERQFTHQDSSSGKLSFARGISVSPVNEDIAVADSLLQQVNVYSIDGEYRFSMDTDQGLEPGEKSSPHQVAVNSQGAYFVTDSCTNVKCFNSNGQLKEQWVSPSPKSSGAATLMGLAMDPEGHVLVGDCSTGYINKHKQDGTYLSSVMVQNKPSFLAVTPQDHIVVAGWSGQPPQIITNTGHVMCTLRHPVDGSQWNTSGVYCYAYIILLANYKSDNILCYSTSGIHLGEVPLPDKLCLSIPRVIAMTSTGKKLVVWRAVHGVQVYSLNL